MTDIDLAVRANERTAVRSYTFTECEFRNDGPDGFLTFEGIASVVDKPYTVRDQYGTFEETIQAGAFDKTLAEMENRAAKAKDKSTEDHVGPGDFALYVNHDYRALPLATVSSGRLKAWTTPDLAVRAFLNPARPSVQEARHAVADGDARQMSIGFTVPKGRDVWNEDYSKRTVRELGLTEASIVWRGANPYTSGAVRSLDDVIDAIASGEFNEDELRRALATLEARLPHANPFALRDAADRAALERKIAARPALLV